MAETRIQRKLAAILAADVVGYSRLMRADEEETLRTLRHHRQAIDELIARHEGRVFGAAGDSVMAEFASAVAAVRCAVAIQDVLKSRNADMPPERRMCFRIGVNVGDLMIEGDNLFGDGVNVAARMEGIATPGGICISGSAFDQVRSGNLPVSFTDMGPQVVKNIAEPVRAYAVGPGREKADFTPRAPGAASAVPDKPSIAVLPFDNMSNDPEQDFFSDGITEDIITELSKISGLFVIARHSAFTYKGRSVGLKQVGQELGVRYVLEGSVRKAASRLRITAQLIDAATDHHMWAERYDRNLEDIFAVQEEVARNVAAALEVALTPGESRRLAQAPTANMEAYDLYKRARSTPFPPTRHNIRSARTAYERIIEMDPTFAGGHAGKSMMHSMAVLFGHSDDPEEDTATAFELARRAVELDPDFPRSHSALGYAYSALGQYEDAIAAARHAVELQPGDAEAHYFYSRCLRAAGLGDEACDEAYASLRLEPQYIEGPYLNNLARATFLAGRYQETVDAYERNAARGGPSYLGQVIVWAAACSLSGHVDRARELVQEILRERPDMSLDKIPGERRGITANELERLREGLRMAGFPE